VALIDFRRSVEQVQFLLVIPVLCRRVWREWVDAAVLSGAMPQTEYAVDWCTPKWDYVNPLQEVNADNAEVQGGLCSISEKLRRRGYKPDLVFAEIKSDMERLASDGTLAYLLAMKSGNVAAVMPAEDAPPPK
jgi:capsid protein